MMRMFRKLWPLDLVNTCSVKTLQWWELPSFFFPLLFNDVLHQSSKATDVSWGWAIFRYCRRNPATHSRRSFFLPLPLFFLLFFSLALYFQLDFSDFWAPAAWVECKGHVRCSSENNPFIVFSISKAFKKNYRCVTAPLYVPLCVTGKWTLKAAFPNFSGYSNGGFLVGCRKLLRIYTFLFFLTYFYPIVSKFCVCVCVLYESCSSILHSRSWSCYSWISQ